MGSTKDKITDAIEHLSGDVPLARMNLSEEEKDRLVAKVGPRTARDILKAKGDYPPRRIPFLFSTVDTQAVVDILSNDVEAAIDRAWQARKKK